MIIIVNSGGFSARVISKNLKYSERLFLKVRDSNS